MKRLRYYFLRVREAGLYASARKVVQRLKPFAFWPAYALGKRRGTPRKQDQFLVPLEDFGTIVRSAFESQQHRDQDYERQVEDRVARALSSSITVLGYGETQKPRGKEWLRDPFHGYSWQPSYFPFCDFVAAKVRCDVKVPWEMSRLQPLVWLAEGATILDGENNSVCRAEVFSILEDWRTANPAGYGVNWTCGMEVAIRAVNIAFSTTPLLTDASAEECLLVAECLKEHLTYLQRFPEISDVPGNHLLADLLGEVVLTAALYGFTDTRTTEAVDHFAHEAELQFEQDGCHIEHATIYHRLSMDMVATALAIGSRGSSPALQMLLTIFERAAHFAGNIASHNGTLPVFGDQDSGFVLWLGDSAQQLDSRLSFKATAAKKSGHTSQYSLLAAFSGRNEDFFPKAVPEPKTLRSGFATIRNDRAVASLKTGLQGLGGRAPHDHDDALQVWLSIDGTDFFVDAGCPAYTLDPKLRLLSILSSSHNGPRLFGQERFSPVTGSVTTTVRGAPTANAISVEGLEIAGELDLGGGDRFTRTVSLSENKAAREIVIRDTWATPSARPVVCTWHVAPDWKISAPEALQNYDETEQTKATFLVEPAVNEKLKAFTLKCTSSSKLDTSIHSTEFSPDYGSLVSCEALTTNVSGETQGWMELRILLTPIAYAE